jgi:hypothetical protein
MVDAGEVFADVGLENVATRSSELGKATQGTMGTETHAVSIGIVNEGGLEDRADDGAEGVMDDTIAVRGGGDHPGLGGFNLKGGVATGNVGLGLEFSLKTQQLGFEVVVEAEDVLTEAFTALGFTGGLEEIGKIDQLGPKIAIRAPRTIV